MFDKKLIENTIGAPLCNSKNLTCCLLDNKMNIIYVNKAFCKVSGYKQKELLGKSVSILLGHNLFKVAFKEYKLSLLKIKRPKKQWFFYSKKGEKLYVSVEVSRVKVEGKKYTLSIGLDISKEVRKEDLLNKENKRLQSAVEGAQLGLWDFNFKTNEFYVNDTCWKVLGYTPKKHEDALPFYIKNTHPEDLKIFTAEKNRVESTGDPHFDIQVRLKVKSGDYIWVHSRGLVVEFGENNSINHLIGTHTDITKQKEAELVIQASEEKYRLLTESLPNIVWTADKDGFINYMNRHGLAFFGKQKRHFEKWSWKSFINPEDEEDIYSKWFFAVETGTAINYVHTFKNKDGDYKWFQVLVCPIKNTLGEVESWIGIASDVDKLIKAEQSLKLSNERLRSLIDASPVAIYSLNKEGLVQDTWNPAAQKLLGWKREEVIGKILPHINDENKGRYFARLQKTIQEGNYKGVISREDKFGELKQLEITCGCVYDLSGDVSEIIVTLVDITELEKNRNKLTKSLVEKETLLQEIHHRVKNNLAIVVSLLQLQVFRSENDVEKFRLTEAQNRVHSIAMVHELLYKSDDFSSVDLVSYYEKLITTIKNNMCVEDQSIEHVLNIEIGSLNINQAIPLGLLINEVVTNSLKYAFNDVQKKGLIALTIRKKGAQILVNYTDNGPGFDQTNPEYNSGLGMRIIQSLLTQLEAKYEMNTTGSFELNLAFEEKGSGPIARAN